MRDLLDVHLPAQWRERCDLNTLKLQPGSFIEPDLKAYYSDILYRVNIDGGDSGYIYVTVEHQSRADPLIAFRLMRYAIAAMQQHITQHKSKTVPRSMALLSLVMKHIFTRDMMEFIDEIALLTLKTALTTEQFTAIMHYILWSGQEKTDVRLFLEELRRKAPQREGELMTMAEQLIAQGEQKGIQKGIQEGIQKGSQEAAENIARTMLQEKFPADAVARITGLPIEKIEALKH